MDVSVIIVNYNTCQMTKECIESVFTHSEFINFEVILVDNASTDGSIDVFSIDSRITYLYSKINLGFGKANNLGLELAKGKYIFLLNSDAFLLNNALKIFFDFAEKAPSSIGCIGCFLKDRDLKDTHSFGNFPTIWNCIDEWIIYPLIYRFNKDYTPYKYDTLKTPKEGYYKVDYITGASLFLKNEICNLYGLFDPAYFMYYEETDMQYRYAQNGLFSVIIEEPQIVHLMEGSSNVNNKGKLLKRVLPLRSLFLYFKKNNYLVKYLFFRFVFAVLYIPIICFSPHKFDDKLKFCKNLFSLRLT